MEALYDNLEEASYFIELHCDAPSFFVLHKMSRVRVTDFTQATAILLCRIRIKVANHNVISRLLFPMRRSKSSSIPRMRRDNRDFVSFTRPFRSCTTRAEADLY